MMQSKNNVLRLAVLAALTAGSMGANAALLAPGATAFSAPIVASEVPTTGITLTAAASELEAGSLTTAFAPSAGQNLLVSVTLNNGAKFGATDPTLTCSTAAGAAGAIGVRNLGGAGTNNVVFTIGTGQAATTVTSCYVTAANLTVTGTHADVNMSITYTYGTLSSSTENGTLVSFLTGLTAGKTIGDDVVALVTGGFVGVSGGIASDLVSAGAVTWKGDTTAAAASGALAVKLDLGSVMGATSGTITVAGAALAASNVTGGVWLTNAAPCSTAGAANAVATAAGGVNSVTFTGLTPAQLSAGTNVCVSFTGSTAIPEGSITATIGGTPLAGYSLPAATTQTLMTVSRNGASASVMNMPRSTDTDAGFLRVYNTSSLAGAVNVTVYDQAGTALATNCSLSSSLASQAALVMSAAQIETACGFTVPTTGRYRLELAGAFPSMQAQMFARSAGVLTNITSFTSN